MDQNTGGHALITISRYTYNVMVGWHEADFKSLINDKAEGS